MKTKFIILGLLMSCAGFGQVYSLDGGGGTAQINKLQDEIDNLKVQVKEVKDAFKALIGKE